MQKRKNVKFVLSSSASGFQQIFEKSVF